MSHHLLELDERGVEHARAVLSEYLPGLDPGLTPVAPRKALLPETMLCSLTLEYGAAGMAAVLHKAGVTRERPVEEAEALDQLFARNLGAQPPRVAPAEAIPGWHLNEVMVEAAWDHWGGPLDIDWGNVKVGQVDTGYTQHPVFGFPNGNWLDTAAGRTFFAPSGGTGGEGPGGGVDPLQDQMDGHGTRVASVICGFDPAAPNSAYTGVAPRVPLVPVRIANHVFISHAQSQLAMALRYLVREAGVSVINLSMGFLPRFQIGDLDRAINETYEAGVILVCAAGQPLESVISPAHGRRTIAAAGSTIGSIPWGKSAYGSAVDWAAPADFIYRAQTQPGGGTGYAGDGDGTSYATAITTGAAALWLARHGSRIVNDYPQPWQRVEAFKAVAKATCKPMPHQRPGSFGAGVLNISALLQQPLPPAQALQPERPT